MLSKTRKLQPRKHVTLGATENGGVLVDLQTGACFELNRVGADIWTRLVAGDTVEEAAEAIRSSYDIGLEIAAADVHRICDEMLVAGLVVAQNEGPA